MAKEVRVIRATKGVDKSNKLRVAAYCRVSTDSEDQANSFFAQVRYYNDYIKANEDMCLVDIYADEGITGTQIEKRDDFKRLVSDVKKKKIDRVLVKSVTRFARNSLECIETVRLFKSCGTSIYFETDKIDTAGMNSEMILYIKSAFAQNEVVSASRRMAVSNRMKMADGTYNLPNAPYGYRLVENELVIVPEEAENVRTIFRLYLNGMGYELIAQYMNEHCKDTKWSMKGIQYIISNERYIGDCLVQKQYTPNVVPFRQRKNRGELPKYYYEDTHEGIIEKSVFYKAQTMRAEKEQKYYNISKRENHKELFCGRLFCKRCGWSYKPKKQLGGLNWACLKQGRTSESCKNPPVSDDRIRSSFVRAFNILKQNEYGIVHEAILQLQTLKGKMSDGKDEISEIDKEIASLSEQNRIYTDLYAQQVLDEISYYEQTDKLKDKITECRSRRLKILNEDETESVLERLRKSEKIVASTDYQMSFDENLFLELTDKIFVGENDDLTFVLKCGLALSITTEEAL